MVRRLDIVGNRYGTFVARSVCFRAFLGEVEFAGSVVTNVRRALLGRTTRERLCDLVELSKSGTRLPVTRRFLAWLNGNSEVPCDEVVFIIQIALV